MNKNPGYYAVIPANVRYDNELKANEKLLFAEITALSNKRGYCWSTNNYFAKLFDVTPETISRYISSLVKKNYIGREIIRDDKNQVKERRLRITPPIDEIVNTPIDEIVNTPIDEIVKGNTTRKNNTTRVKYKNSCREEKSEEEKTIDKIISYLNEKGGLNFKLSTENSRKLIRGRLNDGYKFQDFVEVIDKKIADWKDTEYSKYLRPDTLFRPSNFENYLNEPRADKKIATRLDSNVLEELREQIEETKTAGGGA